MLRAALLAAVVVGCYDPNPQAGSPCSSAGTCPRPLACVNEICVADTDADASVPMPDADLTCRCTGGTLTCAGSTTPCSIGCVAATPAHCARIIPSNGIDPALADALTVDIVLGGSVTINTDTGAITGGFTRAPGSGTIAGVRFENLAFGSTPIGVFAVHALAVPGDVRLTGTHAAAILVGTDATITGTIDGSGGCDAMQACAGPGGQRGTKSGDVITGCGGGFGSTASNGADGGGGGGGNGTAGGKGGQGGVTNGGVAGATTCSTPSLEPLVGGGGGGPGGKGLTTVGSYGGGGGGALQITALGALTITGEITMSGAGGEGGPLAATNAAAGGGGGAGGSVIVEASDVRFVGGISANGGGGGGGGESNAGMAGRPGENGASGSQPAAGGVAGAATAGDGGSGAAGAQAAGAGLDGGTTTNGGGGGGGAGRIVIREPTPAVGAGATSPAPHLIVITTN